MLFQIHHFDVLPSTNLVAKRYIFEGADEGTVIWANTQTAGYGRRGQSWISIPGNLMFSFILYPEKPLIHLTQLSFLTAVVIGTVLTPHLTENARLHYKWPNDVFLNESKVCGVLLETETLLHQSFPAVILGVGLNLIAAPFVDKPTIALRDFTQNELEPQELLNQILKAFELCYTRWLREGFAWVREAWLAHAYALRQNIVFHDGQETYQGRFLDIDLKGGIMLELDPSDKKTFYSGQILI